MDKKDIALKEYLGNGEHFCEFINGVLFQGKLVLDAGKTEEVPTELVFSKQVLQKEQDGAKKTGLKVIHRFRDLTRKCQVDGKEVIIAVQNQSKVDFEMPVRIMTEDALDYSMQCRQRKNRKLHKHERLLPVVSIVFYHGTTKWTAAKKISELSDELPDIMKKLERYMPEHEMLLVTPWNVEIEKLSDDWQAIFEVLKRQNSEKKMQVYLTNSRDKYAKLSEETKYLLFALVDKLDYYEKGETTDLCKAFEDHYQTGKSEGLAYGIYMLIRMGKKHGKSENEILEELKECYLLTEERALKFLKEYEEKHIYPMEMKV